MTTFSLTDFLDLFVSSLHLEYWTWLSNIWLTISLLICKLTDKKGRRSTSSIFTIFYLSQLGWHRKPQINEITRVFANRTFFLSICLCTKNHVFYTKKNFLFQKLYLRQVLYNGVKLACNFIWNLCCVFENNQ